MKKMKRILATCLVVVMVVTTLVGCGKFDAAAYVESCMDLLTKGETEQYAKMNDLTKEEAEADYEELIDTMMEAFDEFDLSEDLSADYRQLFKDIFAMSKYTVKEAKKKENEDGYLVAVEIEQMTGMFDGLQEELMSELTAWAVKHGDEELSDTELNEIVCQIMYDLMVEKLDDITYKEPKTITVDVVGEDKVYSITDESYEEIGAALWDLEDM